jgi:hypothetical protein
MHFQTIYIEKTSQHDGCTLQEEVLASGRCLEKSQTCLLHQTKEFPPDPKPIIQAGLYRGSDLQ